MADFQFSITVTGKSPEGLFVELPEGADFELAGLGTIIIPFLIRSQMSEEVSLRLSREVEGPSKDKATVSIFADSMVIPPGARLSNHLTVEANEAFGEGDEISIEVSGEAT
ncbi:MAG: hypothetical protein JSW58_08580 [Candidatus Latescibacterota bacterium]|nr:MAG: hypothetical protein JSW58_08580 [Candidatus Latescibacterota bacterium]